MQLVSFPFSNRQRHNDAFAHYLQLRHATFVDQLGWPLTTDGTSEQDQYDNPCANYVLLCEAQTVLAGARLLPDTANWLGWRHMAADTRAGKINTMNCDVICPKLDFDGVWECSRLLMNTQILDGSSRRDIFVHLTHAIVSFVIDRGARSVISISPPALSRVLTNIGYRVENAGPVFVDRFDGRRYRAFRMVGLG